ncbi:MAG TPA: aminotransferase class III-fold pyridoxal phosphate-dependent enzyme [Acidimicrobiales bacterium]|nr:aminotransferase class III-fold pyridoxal phosphate-dependent enzyme [Acidimicrobiales bacterium]
MDPDGVEDAATDPLDEPVPLLDDERAAGVLEHTYGITGALTRLAGERDLNFAVRSEAGDRYLLKVLNPADRADVVAMRTGAIAHVRGVDPGLPIADVVRTTGGGAGSRVIGSDGRRSEVQLYRFLDGHVATREELGETALHGFGANAARLGRALRGYFHPAAGYPIQWDLRRAGSLADRLPLLGGESRRLAGEALGRFGTRVAPVMGAFRAQIVHNDLSRDNVLVDDAGEVVGIVDFGDMTHTALVCDLAIAIADVLDGRADSLEKARPMIAGYCALTPLEDAEAAVLGDLVATRLAAALVLNTWRRTRHRDAPAYPAGAEEFLGLVATFGFDDFSALLERDALAASSPGAAARARGGPPATAGASASAAGAGAAAAGAASAAAAGALPYSARETGELVAARRRVLGPLALAYGTPVHLVRGEGAYLFDADGRRYLDAYNNVPVVGHCHPAVADAIAAQSRLLVTNTRYLHEASVELAERLLAGAPAPLDRVLFVNSGSEANDVALRIARHATGGDGILATRHAYHGVTAATTDFSPEEWPADAVIPPHVRFVEPPSDARVPSERGPGMAEAAAELVASGHRPAAYFLDPAFTSDGILGPASDWVVRSVDEARAAGALFVADEVQAGFGRTGGSLWSIAASGVEPDLVTLGKPMGNGFPVAAVLASSAIVDPFMRETGYFSTFGGNTLACTAALAVLGVIEREGLVAHASEVGRHLRHVVDEVLAPHGDLHAVRSWGLLCGIELRAGSGGDLRPDTARAALVVNRLRDHGVLVGTTGPSGNVVKIRPPLAFAPADADLLATALERALRD